MQKGPGVHQDPHASRAIQCPRDGVRRSPKKSQRGTRRRMPRHWPRRDPPWAEPSGSAPRAGS
eukprot:8115030-Heterocapsa_arctica.AAC.1